MALSPDLSRQLARFLHRPPLRRQYGLTPTAWLFHRRMDVVALAEPDDLDV